MVKSKKGVGRVKGGRVVKLTRPVELHLQVTRTSGDVERYLLVRNESLKLINEARKRIQAIVPRTVTLITKVGRRKVAA